MTRGLSAIRTTVLAYDMEVSARSVAPVMAALEEGCGVAASGMCPSPANRADVASRPIQPAPGTYTSAQACRSVKSSLGPPVLSPSSGASWTR